jgi:ribosomal protein L4
MIVSSSVTLSRRRNERQRSRAVEEAMTNAPDFRTVVAMQRTGDAGSPFCLGGRIAFDSGALGNQQSKTNRKMETNHG